MQRNLHAVAPPLPAVGFVHRVDVVNVPTPISVHSANSAYPTVTIEEDDCDDCGSVYSTVYSTYSQYSAVAADLLPSGHKADTASRTLKRLKTCLRRTLGLVLFAASYVLLYMGLYGRLVSYQHHVKLDSKWFEGQKDEWLFKVAVEYIGEKSIPVIHPTTRSLLGDIDGEWSVVKLLMKKAESGECTYLAPYTLVFLGVGLPVLKLISVFYWLVVPIAGQGALHFAAWCSRWTAVDAVVEAIIVALLLKGGVTAEHGIGYVTMVGYCILSTIAIWIMDDVDAPRNPGLCAQLLLRAVGDCKLLRCLPMFGLLLFLTTAATGTVSFPLARLWVPEEAVLYSIKPSVEKTLKPYSWELGLLPHVGKGSEKIDQLVDEIAHCVPKPDGRASLFESTDTLLTSWRPCTVVGSVLLFICVLICPIIEAIFACLVAYQSPVQQAAKHNTEDSNEGSASCSQSVLAGASDLAMLDVFVGGMLIGVTVTEAVGDIISAELMGGYYYLVAAACINILHQVVCSAVMIARQDAIAEDEDEDADLEIED